MDMRNRLGGLDFDTLSMLYEKERQHLTNALLNGASWEEVQEQRRLVTLLAIERHRKMPPANPAEQQVRNDTET
jgi:hypothetical protein